MTIDTSITIRPLSETDSQELRLLAQLDSSPLPPAPLLGAVADGELLAAVSLADESLIADPFRRTTEAVALLRLRARQLQANGRRPRMRARAALAGSPPGAGGRLLSLPLGR